VFYTRNGSNMLHTVVFGVKDDCLVRKAVRKGAGCGGACDRRNIRVSASGKGCWRQRETIAAARGEPLE
jgi:hypothetical protein